jgi:peptidoglycan/xylan/chitin deacetylase (PgdA/CDA1 family)
MYHSVSDSPPPATRRLSVHPEAFDEQLRTLRRQGASTLTFSEYAAALQNCTPVPERSVVLTFDDGYADFYQHAAPALERHGFTATVFVTTGWLADAGDRAAGHPLDRMLSWAQVRELSRAGVEIGAHSHSHPQLDQVPAPTLREELELSRALLEEGTGRSVLSLAYPFGYSNRQVREHVAASGYSYAATVSNTLAPARPDLLALPRLTVRRATRPDSFDRLVRGRAVGRHFLLDRTLTGGYAAVRMSHRVLGRVRSREH